MGPFHSGELELQRRAGVLGATDDLGRGIRTSIPQGIARFLREQRFAVVATADGAGRVWVSHLAGPRGFVAAVGEQMLRLAAQPVPGDPLADDLPARPEAGVLLIDPRTRQRVRMNGRGLLTPDGLFVLTSQVYGNCPKYIQRRALVDGDGGPPGPTRVTPHLTQAQRAGIARADTFFIGSVHPTGGADASHRGGRPGFVRVVGDARLEFAHYPGNGMFNTLGNLVESPRAGLLFVDVETGGLLQLTGTAEVAADFSVRFDVESVRETPGGSPLRYTLLEVSPALDDVSHEGAGGIPSTAP
jgi:predicted pyridoxine 5'-phosphate oxidase superfamily flavin-nucleotide-binding protein